MATLGLSILALAATVIVVTAGGAVACIVGTVASGLVSIIDVAIGGIRGAVGAGVVPVTTGVGEAEGIAGGVCT